jgi:CYTH domain-containing protein
MKKPKKGKHIEIERKFLLKRLPNIKFDSHDRMEQCYCPKGRFRLVLNNKMSCLQTNKTEKRPGVYEEDEKTVSANFLAKSYQSKTKSLSKVRHYKKVGKLTWEVDEYLGMNVIVAEIELPTEKYDLKLPKFIKDVLIMEVTKFPEFKNSNLAE